MVLDQDRYPLSTMNHSPLKHTSKVLPLLSRLNNVNSLSSKRVPFLTPFHNSSYNTIDLSFHVAGCPNVVPRICLVCVTVVLYVREDMFNFGVL